MSHRERLAGMWRCLDDEHRLDMMDRFFSDDYVRHSEEGKMAREEFREALEMLQAGFPDLRTRVLDAISEGNRVAYRWSTVGTHQGTYLGAPPTRRRVEMGGITVTTFGGDGRIKEDWASWNKVSVLHALGIIPIS